METNTYLIRESDESASKHYGFQTLVYFETRLSFHLYQAQDRTLNDRRLDLIIAKLPPKLI